MSAGILYPDVAEFDALIAGSVPVLVDFWADWCMPCRMLTPVIEQLGDKYDGRAIVAKVNVDEHQEIAARFGVQSIPTVIVFKNGEIVDTIVGLRTADVYERAIDALI